MKKFLCCLFFSIFSVMFLISRGESCSATDNILEVKQKYITAAEASTLNTNNEVVHGNTMIAEGDYAITGLNPEFCVNAKQCILKTKTDYDETGR